MQSTFLAAEDLEQGDLLSVDASKTEALAVYLHKAQSGEPLIGRSSSKQPAGAPVSYSELEIGTVYTLTAGASITAGQHLAGSAGLAVPGDSALLAVEDAAEGDKVRAVMTATDVSPGTAVKAKALDTGGQYVGGPDVHMYILNTGIPARSSATVGSDSTPIYLKAGKFTACTSAGGSSGEYCHLDELSTRDAVKSFLLGQTPGAQVKGYAIYNANNDHFSIQWSLPEGQTQAMLVQGVLHNFYNTSDPTKKLPDVPLLVRVESQVTWELDPAYYGGKMGNRAVFDCIITKA